jgi:hypothetical protein
MSAQKRNSLTSVKIGLRKSFIDKIIDPNILDVFAGTGEMWEGAYGKTKNYLGIESDEKVDTKGRQIIFGKSMDKLPSIDLPSFNVFDLDAFANPWNEFDFILQRISANNQVFFLTESLGRSNQDKQFNIPNIHVKPWNSTVIKRDRITLFRTMVWDILKTYKMEPKNFKIFQKKRQPRTIYAGFEICEGHPLSP